LTIGRRTIIADDAGFADPASSENVGTIAQGVVNRSAWDIGKPGSTTAKLEEAVQGQDRPCDGRHLRRATLQAFFVLADAINRAGATAPEAIRSRKRCSRPISSPSS